ncbi:undecaprenyl-diphosphate phosphatase, partial [Enterococcus faecalis]|uniref:undecaprenyl-diphosphate phosphatase n=1 Tax=Enterococcus faecalis TaxID=1351 RepID=UPI003CC52C95
ASFLKIFKFLAKGKTFGSDEIIILLTGSIVALVVSIIAIKFLLNYFKKKEFTDFGWYRVILGAILIGFWLFS